MPVASMAGSREVAPSVSSVLRAAVTRAHLVNRDADAHGRGFDRTELCSFAGIPDLLKCLLAGFSDLARGLLDLISALKGDPLSNGRACRSVCSQVSGKERRQLRCSVLGRALDIEALEMAKCQQCGE
jgi:hypothetical protein